MILQQAKNIIKKILPGKVKLKLNSIVFEVKIKQVQLNHQKALKKIRKKETIKAVFLLIHETAWKYDYVYKLMNEDKRYEPIIVICPFIRYEKELTMRLMNQSFNSFAEKNYRVIKSYNEETKQWLDVKKEINPDIVFFTNPYNLTRPEYLINNFLDKLTCYVPYGFKNSYLHQLHFNQSTQNLVWKFFLETNIHQELARKYSRNKGINTVVSGYPGMDSLLLKNYIPQDVWKIKNRKIKRIIWAPHHSIPNNGILLDFSTFLKYHDFIPEIANRHRDKIQIAFKPHPMLRENLNKFEGWGKQRTDSYYEKWETLPNGQLNESDYLDLFMTSDAMIHDCGSFSIEYLYTSKPVMFLDNDETITDRYNEVGKMAFSTLYHGRNKDEIELFILNIVLNLNDYKIEERINFFNNVVKPPYQITASENIFNYLNSEIFGHKC